MLIAPVDEAGVLERLVDRLDVLREMARVEIDDRVAQALRKPDGPHRPERGAVLDQPLLLAVPPDEMRDVMHIGVRAGCDRGQADRRQRREGRRGAAIVPVLEEKAQRRRVGAPRASTASDRRSRSG